MLKVIQIICSAKSKLEFFFNRYCVLKCDFSPVFCRKTGKNEGFLAFFKGGACRMMVLAPLFGIAQTVYYIGIAEWVMGIPKV